MPPTKRTPITLGGKKRFLRFDNPALVRLEEETGQTATEHFDAVMARQSLRSLTALIWAGLIHEEEGLTRAEAAALVDLRNMEPIGEAVGRAIESAFGREDDAEDEENAKGKAKAPKK